jgi:hypothetical protein
MKAKFFLIVMMGGSIFIANFAFGMHYYVQPKDQDTYSRQEAPKPTVGNWWQIGSDQKPESWYNWIKNKFAPGSVLNKIKEISKNYKLAAQAGLAGVALYGFNMSVLNSRVIYDLPVVLSLGFMQLLVIGELFMHIVPQIDDPKVAETVQKDLEQYVKMKLNDSLAYPTYKTKIEALNNTEELWPNFKYGQWGGFTNFEWRDTIFNKAIENVRQNIEAQHLDASEKTLLHEESINKEVNTIKWTVITQKGDPFPLAQQLININAKITEADPDGLLERIQAKIIVIEANITRQITSLFHNDNVLESLLKDEIIKLLNQAVTLKKQEQEIILTPTAIALQSWKLRLQNKQLVESYAFYCEHFATTN